MQLTLIEVHNKAEELGIRLNFHQADRIKKSVNRSKKGPSIELAETKIRKLISNIR